MGWEWEMETGNRNVSPFELLSFVDVSATTRVGQGVSSDPTSVESELK